MILYLFRIVFASLLLFHFPSSHGDFTCQNDKGEAVDWFVVYKLPKMPDYGTDNPLGKGGAHMFISPDIEASKWGWTGRSIGSPRSMIGRTIQQLYDTELEDISFIFYNDQINGSQSETAGKAKGVVMYGNYTGVWLVHSVPGFPDTSSLPEYTFPEAAYEDAQIFFCVTFGIDQFNEIGKQLLAFAPEIYAKYSSHDLMSSLDEDVQSLFSDSPSFDFTEPLKRTSTLTSLNGTAVVGFGKNAKVNEDIYSGSVVSHFNKDFFVKSWIDERDRLGSLCLWRLIIEDVTQVNATMYRDNYALNIPYSISKDYSRWGISQYKKNPWFCTGDLDRVKEQRKQAGGVLCIQAYNVWAAFKDQILAVDTCPN